MVSAFRPLYISVLKLPPLYQSINQSINQEIFNLAKIAISHY